MVESIIEWVIALAFIVPLGILLLGAFIQMPVVGICVLSGIICFFLYRKGIKADYKYPWRTYYPGTWVGVDAIFMFIVIAVGLTLLFSFIRL